MMLTIVNNIEILFYSELKSYLNVRVHIHTHTSHTQIRHSVFYSTDTTLLKLLKLTLSFMGRKKN